MANNNIEIANSTNNTSNRDFYDVAISIKNLSKIYKSKKKKRGKSNHHGVQNGKNGDKMALSDVSLDIKKGSIFGLLGPNGAGKSTLINIISGTTIKTSGQISIMGDDIDVEPTKVKYHVGVVPQEIIFDPFFTVSEALENHAGYYGVPKKQRKTNDIIKAIGLSDKANVQPRSLSGGMKRRLLVGKALVHSPDIIILDEPTAGVDVELRTQLWEYIKRLNATGITVLLTTHYLEEAEELCDEIAIINHGKLVIKDKTKDLVKILDNKQLQITVKEIIEEIPPKLKDLDCQIIDKNSLLVKYKTKDIDINDIILGIAQANLTIADISTKEADLEDTFRYFIHNN